MQQWATFTTVAGGAAAGLTGLLFISIALAISAQSYQALGAELIVISAIAAVALIALDRRARTGALQSRSLACCTR